MLQENDNLYRTSWDKLNRLVTHTKRRSSQNHVSEEYPTTPRINRRSYEAITIIGDHQAPFRLKSEVPIDDIIEVTQEISRKQSGYLTHLLLNHFSIADDTKSAGSFFRTYAHLIRPHFSLFINPAIDIFRKMVIHNHKKDRTPIPTYINDIDKHDTLLIYERPLLFTDSCAPYEINADFGTELHLSNTALWEIRARTLAGLNRLLIDYRQNLGISLKRINPAHTHTNGIYYCFKVE